jgi:hypothetical protein
MEPIMNILSPNDLYANNLAVNSSYYSLYKDFDNAKLAVLDHIFNTIGNGIHDHQDFINYISLDKIIHNLNETIKLYDKKFFTGQDSVLCVFDDGTEEIRKTMPSKDEKCFVMSAPNAKWFYSICEDDLHKYPNAIRWKQNKRSHSNTPYPNFQKKYSIVYEIDFDSLGDLKEIWINEIIFFYQSCIDFLNSSQSNTHSNAYPSNDPNQDKSRIKDIKRFTEKYEDNEAISKAYEHEFNGDYEEFLISRWEAQKTKWINFSLETIEFLKSKL